MNTNNTTQRTEIYREKAYKNKAAFIKACAKTIADLITNGKYPEDELTVIHDPIDGRTLGEILEDEGKFVYSDQGISIDVNMDSHIYVYAPE